MLISNALIRSDNREQEKGATIRIELVINDSCSSPTLARLEDAIRVTIGLEDDFDEILDICGSELDNEQLQMLHKLWSDDEFPRNFVREGEELIITARL